MKKLFACFLLILLFCSFSTKAATEADSLKQVINVLQSKQDFALMQQTKKIIFFSLIPTLVAFTFLFFIFYRNKRELLFRQKESELNHEIAEVEMKALRAQINPHFIFNCLNSIHRFMDSNKTIEAGEYLVKFSNLIRLVLENSLHRQVPLSDDLFALRLYIEMEQLRMNHCFDYVLNVDAELDVHNVLVPPLIVQPFVENSIWHGLNNKPGRTVTISISRENDMLKYCVEDNGVKAGIDDERLTQNIKKKSLGMSLTQERLDVLGKINGKKAGFKIMDVVDSYNNYKGKRVELLLPFEEAN